jgi:type II secretory pathway component GspD/PulD (secretin)
MASCRVELEKGKGDGLVAAAATQQPPVGRTDTQTVPQIDTPTLKLDGQKEPLPPGTARIGDGKPASPDSFATQTDALKKVQVQKLRAEQQKLLTDAQGVFGRGDTDAAIQLLIDYQNKVRSAGLAPAEVVLLLRPVDSRLEMFRVMKGQADAVAREKKEKREARELVVGRGAAEEQRKAEVQRLVRQYHALAKESKFKEAEAVALQAKQLEPDDAAIAALAHMAKVRGRVHESERIKDEKERFVVGGLNDADTLGPIVTADDPVRLKMEAVRRSRGRGSLDDVYLRTLTPATVEIERKLEAPIGIEFNQVPLSQVLENIRDKTGLPFSLDEKALGEERISIERPVTEKIPHLSVKNFLNIVLEKADLSYVIEHDVIKITTTKRAKGRLFTKVFSVADLITPVPNFALPDYANFEKMLQANPFSSGRLMMQGLTPGMGGATPMSPANGLGGGAPVGATLNSTNGMPGSSVGMTGGLPFGPGGNLQNQPISAGDGPNPLSASAHLAPDRNTKHEQLIKLITGMVRPYSWDGMGGSGRVQYFDLGSALVVNQTADVIQEVANLLEALRRLQDLAMTVEVRVISLSETFFERMGVDFSVNIKTHTSRFEPNLTSGVFRPEPFVNDINQRGTVIGLTPAGTGNPGGGSNTAFTPDLDVPIRSTSFQYAIPGFGGYPNNPGFNGGVSLGLAFLNDIQVYMFMEAAQGDRRINVMQAPKLTLFNGQTSTITIADTQFVVTNVSVVSVNGQIVFIPTNSPLPGPNANIALTIQGVVSADRRFVRLNLPVTLSAQAGATVPLFPITTFITPVFEGGSQGIPIPFTQFLQQPAFTTITVNTTVVCPDGGTVLLGGLKTLGEGRNEFGPPFLSKIPYLNRLFKNVGIGRETRHIMLMVTPRIIINAEEEITQTEGRLAPPGGP